MRTAVAALIAVCTVTLLVGCPHKQLGNIGPGPTEPNYEAELPPGQLALRKITDPRDIPNFTAACSDLTNLRQAVANSLDYMAKPSSQKFFPYGDITHAQALASLKAFDAILASGMDPAQMNQTIRQSFDVYISVGCDNKGTVLYTGYYTPIFDAAPTRQGRFQYPIHKAPANLVKGEDGMALGMRTASGQLAPCPTRAQIESDPAMEANALAYLGDPFEVYIATVQGSVKLRMPDGQIANMGYTANNGYDYVSVSKAMVDDGKIPAKGVSLQAMIAYFKAHPDQVKTYTDKNPRYVFFAPGGDGPRGSLNEPVIPLRSIATDKSIFPRASVAFLSTTLPRRLSTGVEALEYKAFALDQDTGKAIRAAGRADVYMGVGDQAGDLAGRTLQEGRLYYLFLKPSSPGPLTPTAPPAQPSN